MATTESKYYVVIAALGHELLHWQTGFCHVETEGSCKNRAGFFEDTVGHFLIGEVSPKGLRGLGGMFSKECNSSLQEVRTQEAMLDEILNVSDLFGERLGSLAPLYIPKQQDL